MLPVVKGRKSTKRHILGYTILLIALTYLPWVFGYSGGLYAIGNTVLAGLFLIGAIGVLISDKRKQAVQLFAYSIFYLFAWFGLVMIDHALL